MAMDEARVAAKERVLEDESVVVPGDIVPQALRFLLGDEDRDEARQCLYHASPGRSLTVLRVIFFYDLDADHSFDSKHTQTRMSLVHAQLAGDAARSAGDQAYLDAVREAQHEPFTSTARERFVQMFRDGQAPLRKWTKGEKKGYEDSLSGFKRLFDRHRKNPRAAAAAALQLLEEREKESATEMDEMMEAFGKVAQIVGRGIEVVDLATAMEILSVAEGKASKGMDEMLGL